MKRISNKAAPLGPCCHPPSGKESQEFAIFLGEPDDPLGDLPLSSNAPTERKDDIGVDGDRFSTDLVELFLANNIPGDPHDRGEGTRGGSLPHSSDSPHGSTCARDGLGRDGCSAERRGHSASLAA